MTTTSAEQRARRLEVEGFTLWTPDDEGRPLHFTTNGDDLELDNSLENLGTVQVHLGVDLDHDRVVIDSGRTSDLTVLDLAIANLQAIRETLAELMPEAASGRCVGRSDWGRCKLI